jgi:hypothetical protein
MAPPKTVRESCSYGHSPRKSLVIQVVKAVQAIQILNGRMRSRSLNGKYVVHGECRTTDFDLYLSVACVQERGLEAKSDPTRRRVPEWILKRRSIGAAVLLLTNLNVQPYFLVIICEAMC